MRRECGGGEDRYHADVGSMMGEAELDAFVERARSGDVRAFDELLRHFRPRIFRYCFARLGEREGAEDATQETCVSLYTALGSYQDQGVPFAAFVFGIASRKIAMAHRSRARRRDHPVARLPDLPDEAPEPADSAERDDALKQLLAHLEVLPSRQRDILLMRVIAGLSTDETAAALGMSAGNVRVVQHRAMATLRQRLAGEGVSR